MIIFNKILNGLTPKYLLDIIPALNNSCYNTRAHTNLELTQFYRKNNNKKTKKKQQNKTKQNFPSYCVKEWNTLDAKIKNLPFLFKLKKALLVFLKPDENSFFDVQKPTGVKHLNRMRLNFSQVNEHKFRHKTEIETTYHHLLS